MLNVFAFPFKDPDSEKQPYWRDVGTLDSFWQANMELVSPEPQLNMYDENWPIWTYQEQTAPAKFVFDDDNRRGIAVDSTVSGGVLISGSTVKRSLLFSKVRVHSFCDIDESVILPDVVINRGCVIKKAIIDRGVVIPENMEIGVNHDKDRENGFRVTEKDVVLVTRQMLIDLQNKNS